jgi:hypothetical protein
MDAATSSLPLRLAERLLPGRDLAGVLDFDLDGLLVVVAGAVAAEHAAVVAAWDAPVSDSYLAALGAGG